LHASRKLAKNIGATGEDNSLHYSSA